MDQRHKDYPSLIEAIFGLISEPGETAENLLSEKYPKYGATLVIALLLTIFGPMLTQIYYYGMTVYRVDAVFSLFLVLTYAFIVFILVQGLFLEIVGVSFSPIRLFSCMAYSLAPFILVLWLIYLVNYFTSGTITILSLFTGGYYSSTDEFIKFSPFALAFGQCWMVVVFFHCMRKLGNMISVAAISVTLLSFIPLVLSVLIAIFLSDLTYPGSAETFQKILASPLTLTHFAQ